MAFMMEALWIALTGMESERARRTRSLWVVALGRDVSRPVSK